MILSGKACEYCQRLFSWSSKVTTKDVRNASHLLGSVAHPSITLNYLEHIENCKNSRVTRQTFPEKGEMLAFKRVESLHHHPMLIYLDFETANQSLAKVREDVKKNLPPLADYIFFSFVIPVWSCIRLRGVT